MKVRISRVNPGDTAIPLPSYATAGSSGMDVCASIGATIRRGETALIPTGFVLEIPPHYEGQIRPRSGLALKHGIVVLNSPGTIDSDYRGEVKVILSNTGKNDFEVHRGDRIAQLVIAPVAHAEWEEAASVSETARGAGGFGHTGH